MTPQKARTDEQMPLSSGFALIELMVVVAIIGILSAVAFPQYQVYVARSQAARVMSEAAGQRVGVDICVINGIVTTTAFSCAGTARGSSLLAAGGNTMDGAAPADLSVGVPKLTFSSADGSATLVSVFGNSASPVIAGKELIWTRGSDGTWRCTTSVNVRYMPPGCAQI